MRHNSVMMAVALAMGLAAAVGCSSEEASTDGAATERASDEEVTERVQQAQGAGQAVVGAVLFELGFPGTGGNGRACATCHVPSKAFQLTPANVEARYQSLQARRARNPAADDSLFRSVDANDGREDFTNLRRHALISVPVKLAVDGAGQKLVWPVDDPAATSVNVWRAVPSILNTGITAPYQHDGSIATLPAQALSALRAHTQITRDPHPLLLDAVGAFEQTQFSSRSVRDVAQALAAGTTPPPTDPVLTPLEQQGKTIFTGFCATCHGGPTQTTPLPFLASLQNIMVSKPVPPPAVPFEAGFRPSPLTPRLWAFRVQGAPGPVVRASTDPGKALISGNIADLNQFDVPPLYGISKTAPYFHDNSAATLDEVIAHYIAFFAFIQTQPPPPGAPGPLPLLKPEHASPLLAYLMKI